MREPYEIDVTGLLARDVKMTEGEIEDAVEDVVAELVGAIKRADTDQRVTWLTQDGIRCAALVSLEVGHAADPDNKPRPLQAVPGLTGRTPETVPGFTDV